MLLNLLPQLLRQTFANLVYLTLQYLSSCVHRRLGLDLHLIDNPRSQDNFAPVLWEKQHHSTSS
jgi:hypothetical protein